ncbi:unnamed protein product [Tilletia caries]|nr:unnamed protein product [Tilletia caries]
MVRLLSLQRALRLRAALPSSPYSSSAGPGPSPSPSSQVVRCRFAPSPTGFLHLGGLRTALFNVLMVRSSAPGSKFVLRIDDTDRNRYVEGAVESLTRTLRWAGLHWDEGPEQSDQFGPYFQSMRLPLYQRYVDKLLQTGGAYRDFRPASSEAATGQSAGIRLAPYIPPTEAESQQMIDAGKPFVVRLKMPERSIDFDDIVFGHISLNAKDLGNDPILLKSDGWPTYHLASTVDDIEMQITHVFRGEHLALFDALGANPPHFAHLPLLINPDGSKLSKRTGDAHVQAYIDKGYEPEAVLNFVGLMGYNHQNAPVSSSASGAGVGAGAGKGGASGEEDHSEVMDLEALIRGFDISRIARSRASPFFPKLDFLNRQHIRQITSVPDDADDDSAQQKRKNEVIDRARSELVAAFGPGADLLRDKMVEVLLTIGERATTVKDLVEEARFLFETPDWTAEPAQKLLRSIVTQKNVPAGADVHAAMRLILDRYTHELSGLKGKEDNTSSNQSEDPMTRVVPAVLETLSAGNEGANWKAKVLSTLAKKTLRWAVSGGKPGPAVADVIGVMGAEAMQSRLQTARGALDASLSQVDPPSNGSTAKAQ